MDNHLQVLSIIKGDILKFCTNQQEIPISCLKKCKKAFYLPCYRQHEIERVDRKEIILPPETESIQKEHTCIFE